MEAKKLAIAGKVIDVTKIGDKSLAQFRDQLRRNNVNIPEEQFEIIYTRLTSKKEAQHENQ